MLHKAEEWKLIGHAPKIKMMNEHGRHLRLDDEAERKLMTGALACSWRPRTRELFRDIVILMRDTGMRNERELFRMRIENLDWQNRVISQLRKAPSYSKYGGLWDGLSQQFFMASSPW